MRILFLILLLPLSGKLWSQTVNGIYVRAFPITDYMVDLNDSVKLLQVNLEQPGIITEKQTGLLQGTYRDKHADTLVTGSGRCQLIKGSYYYFAINYNKKLASPRAGDLIYIKASKPVVYDGRLLKIASRFIELQNVYEEPLYDRYEIFSGWTSANEQAVLDSMLADIKYTGDYFLKNSPAMNVKIKGGPYDGKMVLETMLAAKTKDLTDFLDYINARPRLYAGRQWKTSEIFATWLSEGSPTPIPQ